MSNRHDHLELSQSEPITETLNARTLSRRGFLVVTSGALLASGFEAAGLRPALAAETPTHTLDLARPADMLRLHFDFYNLVLSTATNPPQLVRPNQSAPSQVAVTFTSQHVMEETVFEDVNEPPLPGPGNIRTRAVGPSRIVFTVPTTVKSLPYNEDGLFAWWQWVMRVPPRALPPGGTYTGTHPVGTPPGELETDLLLVDWLHLSPDHLSTWAHAPRPVTRGGRTELWHTRLATRATDGKPSLTGTPTVRAISAEPLVGAPANNPFKALRPPSADQAPETIVKQTTDYAPAVKNAPVSAELVLLSAAGATLELEGHWDVPATTAKWQHRSWIGRDNYVRVETRGYLFPFGNRATLISESQRKFASDGSAYLFQRQFIVIREPVKNYPDAFGYQPNDGRQFPFRQIRLTTLVTPNLPLEREEIEGSTQSFWVPTALGGDLPFPVVAIDQDQNTVEFTCSLAFVNMDEAHNFAPITNLVAAWQTWEDLTAPLASLLNERRILTLNGQSVAFSPPNKPGETTFGTGRFYLGADRNPTANVAEMRANDLPNFFPIMMAADVRMPAVAALSPYGAESNISYDPVYVKTKPALQATQAGPADLWARVQLYLNYTADLQEWFDNPVGAAPNSPPSTGFPKTSTGGVALPDLDIGALSREFGPLSGTPEALSQLQELGKFNPADYFKDEATKLLGSIPLNQILQALDVGDGGGGPTIKTRVEYENDDQTKPPIASLTTLDWKPKLKDQVLPGGKPGPFEAKGNGENATLELHAEFRTDFKTQKSTSKITGELRNFTIHLVDRGTPALNFIAISFTKFNFEQHNDAKPKLDPELSTVKFQGPLNFVNTLQKFLQTAGVGPAIDVQPNGVTVSYTLALPNIGIGVFALQNMSFSAGLTLPFDDRPVRARFGFCSREQKFLVSVYVFAGGGFFALELGPDGLVMLEAAIEFGGNLSLDLVVASGSVTVMAGIYFKMEKKSDGDYVTLTGYLRATGRVSVLGLITITAEFYLGLSYTKEPGANRVEGEASLTVSIDILFFSASVTLRVRKQFAGPSSTAAARAIGSAAAADGGPTFADLMSPSDWNTYCDSFAA